MLRKSDSIIIRCKFKICNQISHIDNPFFVIRCQIFNYLINKLTLDGKQKMFTKVAANISDFRYSGITIGV